MSDSDPVQLAYNEFYPAAGVKNENPIIFLHGVTASKEYWKDVPQIAADATNRKVYAVDARNHGDSEWNDEFNYDSNVADLVHFLHRIGAGQVILVGHSLGGMTSMRLALMSPEKVEKLFIEDMKLSKIPPVALHLTIQFLSTAQSALDSVPANLTIDEAKQHISRFVYDALPENIKPFMRPDCHDHRILLKANSAGRFSYKSNYRVIEEGIKKLEESHEDVEGVYEGPTCFVYGKKSPFRVNEDEEIIKQHFPNAKFIGIEDASHTIHSDAPTKFIEELVCFLKE